MKVLTLLAFGLLFASISLNAVATQLTRAQPWLTISLAMLLPVAPILLVSAVVWVVKPRRRATDLVDEG